MTIAFSCPNCRASFNVADADAAKTAACGSCGTPITIPNSALAPQQDDCCAHCGQPAHRACIRCGRFFCAAHGGYRLVGQGAGRSYEVVTRGVCDSCTPDQELKKFQFGCQSVGTVISVIGAIIVLFIILGRMMK